MRFLFIASILLVASMAGCLGNRSDSGEEPGTGSDLGDGTRYVMPEDPMAEGAGHSHADSSQHKFLWNYDFTSNDPLLGSAASMSGVHALWRVDDYLYGAVYGAHAGDVQGGLVIWSLADPEVPVEVGRWTVPGFVGGDRSLGVTPDGNYAVLSTEAVTCFTQVNPDPVRVYLIDVTDKTLPVVADVVTATGQGQGSVLPGGVSTGKHSIWVQNIGGMDMAYIFGDVYRIEASELGAALVDTGVNLQTGHDLYVRELPNNESWALVANGGPTYRVWNVTDPLNPAVIGEWGGPSGYYMHTSDLTVIDGYVYSVLTSEDWLDSQVSNMWIFNLTALLDAPDEAVILEPIGEWHNPGNHTAAGISFSLHNPRFTPDGVLTLSSYHGGLWTLDFRHPTFRSEPAVVGYAAYAARDGPIVMDPVMGADYCNLGYGIDTPSYMDVELGDNGIMYAAGVWTGLYTFAPTDSHPIYGNMTA